MQKSTVVEKLYADGRYGKKNGKGLYLYEDGKRQGPDPTVYKLLGIRYAASGRRRRRWWSGWSWR